MKKMHGLFFGVVAVLCAQVYGQEPEVLPRAEGVLRVVAFGDSITGDRPGIAYRHQYIKWSDILQGMLEVQLGMGKAEVLNMGFAGDRTFQVGDRPGAVNRVESNILAQKPDIVVMLIGGNNMGMRNRDPKEVAEQTREELARMVREVREAGIKVLLLQYAEPKAENMEKVWTHLDDVNPIIAAVAEAEGVPTLALQPCFAAAAEILPINALLNPVDGVHLQPYGELVVARAVAAKLRALGWTEGVGGVTNDE